MPARRSARLGSAALGATLAGSLIAVGAATADPLPPSPAAAGSHATYPSRQQVDAARARAARAAGSVGAIRSQLVLADQRLQAASLRAEEASEAYNGALWRLQQARSSYDAARADAARARRTLTAQRNRMGALVAQSYQQGGQVSALDAVMGADGPQGVLDQYAAFQGASSSLQADYQRFTASEALSRVFEARAQRAKEAHVRLAAQARQAQRTAVAAARAAQGAEAAIAAEKDRLVAQLARAQHVSVALARSRQSALEAIARRRAEERERRQALAAARARAAARAAADRAASAKAGAATTPADGSPAAGSASTGPPPASPSGSQGSDRTPGPAPDPAPASDPAPAPLPEPAPVVPAPAVSSGAAARAIAFAEAQLGDPYQWGAAGPGSWDCSGLMMGAWGAAGVALPHYSVAQYEAGTPVSVTDLRPGDLVFWSSNGRPSGIHHVAMYIGGGQIIHAPRTGRPVEIDDMYYWIPPTFFARV